LSATMCTFEILDSRCLLVVSIPWSRLRNRFLSFWCLILIFGRRRTREDYFALVSRGSGEVPTRSDTLVNTRTRLIFELERTSDRRGSVKYSLRLRLLVQKPQLFHCLQDGSILVVPRAGYCPIGFTTLVVFA